MKLRKGFYSSDDLNPLIPRLVVGLIFLSEGIQKFLFPELVGAGRFEKIGFENPEFWALFVAFFRFPHFHWNGDLFQRCGNGLECFPAGKLL